MFQELLSKIYLTIYCDIHDNIRILQDSKDTAVKYLNKLEQNLSFFVQIKKIRLSSKGDLLVKESFS